MLQKSLKGLRTKDIAEILQNDKKRFIIKSND